MIEKLSEKQFRAQVLELAKLSGWLAYHTHDSRCSAPSLPDPVHVRPPAVHFAELQRRGRTRTEQKALEGVRKEGR